MTTESIKWFWYASPQTFFPFAGKLAHWLKQGGHRPLLVSVDVYRPAAREQLKVVAQAIGARIYEGQGFRRTARERPLVIRVPVPGGGVLVPSGPPVDLVGAAEREGKRRSGCCQNSNQK